MSASEIEAPILLLPPGFSDDSVLLWRAAIARGWDTERLRGWHVPDTLAGRNVAIYGESFFVGFVAESLGRRLVSPPLDWLTQVPREYLLRDVGFMTLAEARHQLGARFWKPADDKLFPAKVYESANELPALGELPDETPVLWSDPVHWTLEYRCFVSDRQVRTLSPYWRNGELARAADASWPASPEELDEALSYGAKCLSDPRFPTPQAFVLDIGRIEDRGWAVIEANPAWASGLYGCDPCHVLDVVARATGDAGNP